MQTLRQHWTIFSIVLLIAGAAWTWASAASPGSTTSGNIPAPRQGFLAPDFTLRNSQGQQIQLSSLRGKAVLVNVWASWCMPCKEEMPAIQRVYAAYKDQGLVVLGVNSTSQDDPAQAISFADNLGLTFPILFDTNGSVAHLYQVRALPTSFFVDPQGIIQDVVVGGPMSEALLRLRVDNILPKGGE